MPTFGDVTKRALIGIQCYTCTLVLWVSKFAMNFPKDNAYKKLAANVFLL